LTGRRRIPGILGPLALALTLAAGWCGLGSSGFGQVPPAVPGTPAGMPSGANPVAAIDTATAVLEFPDPALAPAAFHTVQDTVLFGDLFHVILDYPAGHEEGPEARLASGGDWLKSEPVRTPGLLARLMGRTPAAGPDMSGLTPAAGGRVVWSGRIYRTGPFRVQVGDAASPVIQVKGRVAGTGETATIRAPRPVGWSPLALLLLLAALVLVLLLFRLFRGRDRRGQDFADRPLPAPAWLTAAVELRDLLRQGSLNRGDSRVFLDGLARITRRFVAGRYRIAAQEMTGREIIKACGALGHASTDPAALARMIDEADLRRYDPDPSSAGWCREQAISLYDQIGRVRILPRYVDVAADLLRDGEAAWADLDRELSPGGRPLRRAGAPAADREE